MRFELCIFTANDNDVRSGGNGIISVSRVIDNEHNLQNRREKTPKMKQPQKMEIFANAFINDINRIKQKNKNKKRARKSFVEM